VAVAKGAFSRGDEGSSPDTFLSNEMSCLYTTNFLLLFDSESSRLTFAQVNYERAESR